ncbi:MAG: MFS family permease [Salibacteraceae bacterium]
MIVVCPYVGYKITADFSLYAQDVLGFDEVSSSILGTGTIWMRPIFALSAGFLADKISGVKVISISFLLSCLGGFLLFFGWVDGGLVASLLNLTAISAGIFGIRGVYFAIMGDSKINYAKTGTAVGVISVLGYTPDVFMSPLMVYLLDNYPGIQGHQYVFGVLALFSLCGFIASLFFKKLKT